MNTRDSTKVAFLGLGAMGARMAARLIREDTDLRVWNRSGRTHGFASLAPHLAPTVSAAVEGADVVIAMVTDDRASRDVWLGAGVLKSMRRGAVAVDCSTLSPTWVEELAQRAHDESIEFLDAPVVGSRPQADAGNLIFLAGGAASAVETAKPVLLRMGSAIHHLGASPAGALTKLLANVLFTTQVATLAEIVAVARHAQLELFVLSQALEGLPLVSPSAKAALAGMVAGAFAPMFPMALAAKELQYAVAQASAAPTSTPMMKATRDVFEQGLRQGLHDQNLTAVVKLYGES